jgi:hypothetical protein
MYIHIYLIKNRNERPVAYQTTRLGSNYCTYVAPT